MYSGFVDGYVTVCCFIVLLLDGLMACIFSLKPYININFIVTKCYIFQEQYASHTP